MKTWTVLASLTSQEVDVEHSDVDTRQEQTDVARDRYGRGVRGPLARLASNRPVRDADRTRHRPRGTGQVAVLNDWVKPERESEKQKCRENHKDTSARTLRSLAHR